MTGHPTPADQGRAASKRRGQVAALVVVALASVACWLALRDSGSRVVRRGGVPVAMSLAALQSLQLSLGHPVYWVGPQGGYNYEVTRTPGGNVYIRYLPAQAPIGDPRASFVVIGTYPMTRAFATVAHASRRLALFVGHLPRRGLGVTEPSHPRSVYVAYPRGRVMIEIYAPNHRRAQAVARSGDLRPVG